MGAVAAPAFRRSLSLVTSLRVVSYDVQAALLERLAWGRQRRQQQLGIGLRRPQRSRCACCSLLTCALCASRRVGVALPPPPKPLQAAGSEDEGQEASSGSHDAVDSSDSSSESGEEGAEGGNSSGNEDGHRLHRAGSDSEDSLGQPTAEDIIR
jgi:hypothetical protein